MSLIWAPREHPERKPRGKVVPFMVRWKEPLEEAAPEVVAPEPSARTSQAKTLTPITVLLRVRY